MFITITTTQKCSLPLLISKPLIYNEVMRRQLSRFNALALATGCLLTSVIAAHCDSYVTAEPKSFHCRGFSGVAEIFPPQSRQNSGDKPLCYFYELGYPGAQWDIKPKLVWKAELVNERMPQSVVVSMAGEVVTLDEYARSGYQNAVVIYNREGHLIKSFHLDDLVTSEDRRHIVTTAGSRHWRNGARYFFLPNPARFLIALPWGKVLQFDLSDAKLQAGTVAEFPSLAPLLASSSNIKNEEALVWSNSLRFSSITDIVNPKFPLKTGN